MGKIRKAVLQEEKETLRRKKVVPRKPDEEWDVSEEGFYKDDVDVWNEEKEHLLLDPSIEAASYSEDDDSDTEVLPLDLPAESDDENLEEDDNDEPASESEHIGGEVSDKAWGQRKTSFYDADYVGDDAVHSSDESLAEEEEREAIALQQRMLESLEHHHYGLDQLLSDSEETDVKSSVVTVSKELSDMTETEKFSLLEHQWPEFLELYDDLTESMAYSKNVVGPLIEAASSQTRLFTKEGLGLIRSLQKFNNLYCLNVMFYITLRASQVAAEDHPVIKRIIELRDILGKIKTGLGKTDELLDLLKNCVGGTEETKMADNKTEVDGKSSPAVGNKRKHNNQPETKDETESPLEFYNRIKEQKRRKKEKRVVIREPIEEEVIGSDGKRGITFQIAKNKGLTPKRKKEQRNPRVKHRKKFVKAVKRYRKVVRPVESEMERYGGERGGIKSRLSRSIKIK